MSFDEFRQAVAGHSGLPPGLTPALVALWHDDRGDWDAAHTAAQADNGADGAWVHAYLHRKEGDLGNAAYWYRRAGKAAPEPAITSAAEWEQIARALLGKN